MNIVGLGNAGCKIAKIFEEHEQYKTYYIDTENSGYDNFFRVKKQNSHEEYEKNYKKIKFHLGSEETTFILSGAGDISGCILRILEQLKNEKLTILYIKPDFSHLTEVQKTKHRITFGVLQQYARSNLFKMMYVVSNEEVEKIVENVSIKDYWRDINNIIFSTYHMINVFNNNEPLLTTCAKIPTVSKIATLGVVNYETGKEKLFYDLQFPRLRNYFYGINDATLEQDREILHNIRAFVSKLSSDKTDVGFAIYSTDYDHNYVYSAHYASFIQEQKIE